MADVCMYFQRSSIGGADRMARAAPRLVAKLLLHGLFADTIWLTVNPRTLDERAEPASRASPGEEDAAQAISGQPSTMMVYFVIADQNPDEAKRLASRITKHYGESRNHALIPNSVWAVTDARTTTVDVCRTLGIGEDAIGVVVRADQYYGRYDSALWQRMQQWEAADAR